MKTEWLQYTVLRAASLLAPGDQRAEWVKEWRSPPMLFARSMHRQHQHHYLMGWHGSA
jgi:hypothetical protein